MMIFGVNYLNIKTVTGNALWIVKKHQVLVILHVFNLEPETLNCEPYSHTNCRNQKLS